MVRVRVPATSANLGPAFDSLGIALTCYNEYEFSIEDKNDIVFEGVEKEFQNKNNIIFMAMKKVFDKYNTKDIIEEVSSATINRAYELSKL